MAFIIVVFDASGIYRSADWLLLVPDIPTTNEYNGVGFVLGPDSEKESSIFSAQFLKTRAVGLGDVFLRNKIRDKSEELFHDLYRSGEIFKFEAKEDSKSALLELVLFGTEEIRVSILKYRDAVAQAGEKSGFAAEVQSAFEVFRKFPLQARSIPK